MRRRAAYDAHYMALAKIFGCELVDRWWQILTVSKPKY